MGMLGVFQLGTKRLRGWAHVLVIRKRIARVIVVNRVHLGWARFRRLAAWAWQRGSV